MQLFIHQKLQPSTVSALDNVSVKKSQNCWPFHNFYQEVKDQGKYNKYVSYTVLHIREQIEHGKGEGAKISNGVEYKLMEKGDI